MCSQAFRSCWLRKTLLTLSCRFEGRSWIIIDIIFWSSSFLHDYTFTLHEPRTSIMSYNDLKPMSAKQFDFKSISSLEDVKCYQTYFLCSVWWGHSAWMNVRPDTVSSMTLLSYELNAVYIIWVTNGSKSQGFTAGFYQEQNSVSISDCERKKLDNWTVFSFVLLNVRLSDVFMTKVWSVGFLERVRLSWVSHSVCVCVCVCVIDPVFTSVSWDLITGLY